MIRNWVIELRTERKRDRESGEDIKRTKRLSKKIFLLGLVPTIFGKGEIPTHCCPFVVIKSYYKFLKYIY